MSSYQQLLTTLSAAENLDTIVDIETIDEPLYHDLTKESLAYFNSHFSQKKNSSQICSSNLQAATNNFPSETSLPVDFFGSEAKRETDGAPKCQVLIRTWVLFPKNKLTFDFFGNDLL